MGCAATWALQPDPGSSRLHAVTELQENRRTLLSSVKLTLTGPAPVFYVPAATPPRASPYLLPTPRPSRMSQHRRVRMSRLTLGLLAALAAAPAFAQSTSAGVGGQIFGSDGQPVIGAEVTIVHTESGTVSRVATDASGRYSARGLRVGGPYEITITKPGAGTRTEDNVYLGLNQANTVNAQLTGDVTTLATVTAVGVAGGSEIFSATKMGTGTSLTNDTLEALPSASRNIQDYIRLDPRISQVSKADGSISAGGQNSRFNVIRIDGVSNSDPFGLEANNMPTERQPVSMDAIEEIQIDLANYDTT